MALVLKQNRKIKQDQSEINLYEFTQDYLDDPNGGWGVTTSEGTNPSRADRAVVAFCVYTDEDETETYATMLDQYIGSDQSFSVAPGAGLLDTDMSMFRITFTEDGHHTFYTIPIEQYVGNGDEPASPAEYYMYYNTTNSDVQIYVSGAYVTMTEDHLDSIKSNSDAKICHQLIDIKIGLIEAEDTLEAVEADYDKRVNALNKWFELWDEEERKKSAQLAFYGNSKAVARDMIKTLTNR